ncbi:MAG: N-acetylglucosamine-6-phosphate deacetylase [Clostridia bacterium]|jgi:N-acetylglucosamine-6-phosphate deacetylase
MKYFKGAKIITEDKIVENHVFGFDKNISEITSENEFSKKNIPAVDARGLYIAPGLIDGHIHGSGGQDAMYATPEAIRTISTYVAKNGVTGFLGTTMTMSWDRVTKALDQIRESMKEELPGAQLLGAHIEGPFISSKFKGAQNEEYILNPEWDLIEPYKDIAKIIALAPELPGAIDFIQELKKHKIVASLGHTSATYEEAMKGIEAGVSHCTHLFNAMTGIHHRNAGAAVAALSSDINCELIADKIHVHYGLFEFIRKAKGADRINLITDCIEAGGMEDGKYALGGQAVFVKDGSARLEDGTLAGSILHLNEGVLNFFENTNIELHDAFKLSSLNLAKELGIDDRKGSLTVGKDADFCLIDKDFNVKATYVMGKCVYKCI